MNKRTASEDLFRLNKTLNAKEETISVVVFPDGIFATGHILATGETFSTSRTSEIDEEEYHIQIWKASKKWPLNNLLIFARPDILISCFKDFLCVFSKEGSNDERIYDDITMINIHTDEIRNLYEIDNTLFENVYSAVSFDNKLAVSTFEEIIIFKEDFSIEETIRGFGENDLTSLVTFANETFLAGCADGKIFVWDLKNNYQIIHTLEPEEGSDTIAVFNDRLVSTSIVSRMVYVWNSLNGSLIRQAEIENMRIDLSSRLVKFLEKDLVVVSDCEYLFIFDIANGQVKQKIEAHDFVVTGLTVLKDGSLVTVSEDSNIKIWKQQK